jgi:hydrogenase maturation factor HypF (carbamoyltransferase family)
MISVHGIEIARAEFKIICHKCGVPRDQYISGSFSADFINTYLNQTFKLCPKCQTQYKHISKIILHRKPREVPKNEPHSEVVAILKCKNKECDIEWETRLIVPSWRIIGVINDSLLGGGITCPKCDCPVFSKTRVTVGRP